MLHWIDLLWLGMACIAGVLTVIHLAVALRQRESGLHFSFSVLAAGVAISATLEWLLMRASTPAEYATLLRWEIVVFVPLSLSLLYIVNALSPGPRWLWVTIVGTRIMATIANFTTGDNLAFLDVQGLQGIALWGGDHIVRGIGTVNPWVVLGQVSNLLLEAFTVVAIVRLLRHPASAARQRKLRILFSALAFMLFATFWNVPFILLDLRVPVMVSPPFLVFALVMAFELSGDILRAADMARALRIAETSLRGSLHNMAVAERAAGLGTWCWDLQAQELNLAPRSLQLLGFATDARPTPAMIGERMEPEDFDRLRRTLVQMQDESAEEFSAEFRVRPLDDGPRWIAVHGQIDPEAEPPRSLMRGVMFDATDRHRVDELFRSVVWASPTALLVVDDAGRIVLANATAATLTGYGADALVGMPVETLLPEAQAGRHSALRRQYADHAVKRSMNQQREVALLHKDGNAIPIQVSLNPVMSGGQQLVIAAIDDLRERKAKDLELSRQRDALAHLARVGTMSELSGSLAHELNQPLAAILSNAQASVRFLNRAEPDLAEVREGLAQIIDSDKRAGEIIRRLRAMLRNEASNFIQIGINEVVRDVLRIVRSDLIDRDIAIREELTDDLPLIRGDRVQLQQVLLNLIRNAVDAMSELPDGRRLTLSTHAAPGGVLLQVVDIGPGIPEADIERIFAPFVSTKVDGLGFGLSLCTSLIQAHGGKLWASNNRERGATFHVFLPFEA